MFQADETKSRDFKDNPNENGVPNRYAVLRSEFSSPRSSQQGDGGQAARVAYRQALVHLLLLFPKNLTPLRALRFSGTPCYKGTHIIKSRGFTFPEARFSKSAVNYLCAVPPFCHFERSTARAVRSERRCRAQSRNLSINSVITVLKVHYLRLLLFTEISPRASLGRNDNSSLRLSRAFPQRVFLYTKKHTPKRVPFCCIF